jgi:exodeoxyribonuclease VII large subunit
MIEEKDRPRIVRTVRQFTNGIARWFATHRQLQNVAISGEISGLHEFGNGHLGFTLKEEQAVLECVVWADARESLPGIRDGAAAIATGNVRVRTERSGYQLLVESIELTGLGELFLLYERLKEKLRREGLFDPGRKRTVPELPRRVALITARGKAMQDFVETLERNAPFVEVVFVETRVQGLGAEVEIATALDDASKRGVDAIVLTRGGGSYEDLFPFNLEAVVRAIVRAKAPVITAIGHSGDHHLADDVADKSFGTPSLAAESIAKGWVSAARRLQIAKRDLDRAVRDVLLRGEQRVAAARNGAERASLRIVAEKLALVADRNAQLERRNPQRLFAEFRARFAQGSGRLDTAAARLVARKSRASGDDRALLDRAVTSVLTNVRRGLDHRQAALGRIDPLAPLARGYAIVTKNGAALRDVAVLSVGDEIEARLERGMLQARVESVHEHD